MHPTEPQLNTKKFLIIGVIALILLYGIQPIAKLLGLDSMRYSPEVISYAEGIETYSPASLQRYIASSDRPVLVHFFASWCPYCQQQNPILNDVLQAHPDTPARVISVDDDTQTLAQYLMTKPELYFTPYIMAENDYNDWIALLKEYGIDYQGNIPFTVLLDKDKKVVAQFRGVVDKASLTAAINAKR